MANSDIEARVERIESRMLAEPFIPAREEQRATLAQRMAHYNTPGVSVAVINDGRIELRPSSESTFFADAVDSEISFVKGDDSRVNELVLRQEGSEIRAKKMR